ncbi:retrovirus-related pol polyprotein from transposon TNT 1-94 [Tanacetum coccineum]|uniref:Retrovirus-related pol polyprotein from transposon TNT 1-94 n=1 Tax=Tanacetum coccineum TaxID=301880 RepID=A0ABQ5DMR2_9ASTR
MHEFYQRYPLLYNWNKDQPLERVCEDPSMLVQTRKELATDPKMCMFALTVSTAEPKNIKEEMVDHVWIEAMWEELHQFDRPREEDIFSPVTQLEAVRIFIASICQSARWVVDPHHPKRFYHLSKGLYGLKQTPRAWYDKLSKFMISKGFTKGTIDPTLFTIRYGEYIMLVQLYIDDIIFESTNPNISKRFVKLMKSIFEMSMMGELKFLLRTSNLPIPTRYLHIFKNHGMDQCDSIGTPMATSPKMDADLSGTPGDQTKYDNMIGSFIYLTASRPDLVHATYYYARYEARLKITPRSTFGGIQFLGDKLVSWSSKKQDCTTMSTVEAETPAEREVLTDESA